MSPNHLDPLFAVLSIKWNREQLVNVDEFGFFAPIIIESLLLMVTASDINYTNGYTVFPRAAQKMNFSIKDFFSKCDQIRRKLRKSLMKNSFFVQSRYISFWNNLSHTQQTFICSK